MISASKYQHIIYTFFFVVPFCYFFSMGRPLCYVSLFMRGFFHRMDAFLLLFLYVGGLFATSSSWCGAFFTMWGPFLLFFSPCGGTFFLHGGFYVFMRFYGLAPSPYDLFCGRKLLCNFHPCPPPSLTAAIMYPTKPTATPVFNSQ